MAIEKETTLKNGAVGNYWRIVYISVDNMGMRMTGSMGLFKDKAFSDGGGRPLTVRQFSFPFTKQEFISSPSVINLTYVKILQVAAETISFDLNGNPIDPPRYRDPDLVGGTPVLE